MEDNIREAERLEEIAIQMYEETDDVYRKAEINNIRGILSGMLCGFLDAERDKRNVIEASHRLIYLQLHPKDSGMHSQYPNAINKGVIRKR